MCEMTAFDITYMFFIASVAGCLCAFLIDDLICIVRSLIFKN